MRDSRRSIQCEVSRARQVAGAAIFLLQHFLPDSPRLEAWRRRNALGAARRLEPRRGREIEIERRKDLGEAEFVSKYLNPGVPVVFEGGARDWPCTRKWGLSFLEREHGDEEFSVIDIPGLVEDEYATVSGHKSKEVLLKRVSARDFVQGIRRGSRAYLRACPILETRPELLQDLDLHWLKRMRRCLLGASFQSFIGSGGRTTTIHSESTAFFFVLAEGAKRWTLFSPSSSVILNPAPERHGYRFTRVKVKNPDLTRYPGFDRLSRYVCELKKGDILFVPAWMWHEVDTLSESWGVSYRFTHVRGFARHPAFAFARVFLVDPPLLETLYYSFFSKGMGNRRKNLLVPRLYLKD